MIESVLEHFDIAAEQPAISTGKDFYEASGPVFESLSPVNGRRIGTVKSASLSDYKKIIEKAKVAAAIWKSIPAPRRGKLVRDFGDKLRANKTELAHLVSYEMGKSTQEGLGEVQEMIDICEFAVGLSRQLYGLSMKSERPNHRMYEQWHPLGIVGIISAFNFPVAVWSWNAAIAWVCGNVTVWKPSEKTPYCAIACQKLMAEVLETYDLPEGISNLVLGDANIGQAMAQDPNMGLVSATGSTKMGRSVAQEVSKRLGKYLLELGGNNAIIVTENADLDVLIPAVVFGTVGTTGQRCTSTRRLIVHERIISKVKDALISAYGQLRIGDPLDPNNHVGPLIDDNAVLAFEKAIKKAAEQGGEILFGGNRKAVTDHENGHYVTPALIMANKSMEIVKVETFAPILYLLTYSDLEEAIEIQNSVPQGLSSAIFTNNIKESERFLSASGSDCGIANVNIGTSGAEIGGAFGGEKDTGGGRESGSDAWKAYMRRQTCTINYGSDLPLAQGIEFKL